MYEMPKELVYFVYLHLQSRRKVLSFKFYFGIIKFNKIIFTR